MLKLTEVPTATKPAPIKAPTKPCVVEIGKPNFVFTRTLGTRDTKKEEKAYKVKWLYEVFGISKQVYYQRLESDKQKEKVQGIVL